MKKIPLLHFRHTDENTIPFEIDMIEQMPKAARADYPKRHTFYELIWITSGSGTHFIDYVGYDIHPQTLYCIAPGQIHYWAIQKPITGFIILFEKELFTLHGAEAFLHGLNLFRVIGGFPTLHLPGKDGEFIQQAGEMLRVEHQSAQFGRTEAIVALLRLLLIDAQRHLTVKHDQQPRCVSEQLTRHFLELVEQQVTLEHHLPAYAQELGVTVGHLTETIKKTTGLPAGVTLRQRLALEAKRWLAHSNLTVSEIAYQLNFKDPSYFGRFFKRETERTPRAFRNDFRRKYQN